MKKEYCLFNGNNIGVGYTYNLQTGDIYTVYDVSDSQELISNSYNNGKLSKISFVNKFTDKNNQQQSKTTQRKFEYQANNLSSIQDDNALLHQFTYYKNGLIKTISIGGKELVSYEYDHINGLDVITISYINGKTVSEDKSNIEQERITYNKYGKVLKVERKKIGNVDFEMHYEVSYETKKTSNGDYQDFGNGRLLAFDGYFGYNYSYDYNNRLSHKEEAGVKTVYQYNTSIVGIDEDVVRNHIQKSTEFEHPSFRKVEQDMFVRKETTLINLYEKNVYLWSKKIMNLYTECDKLDRKTFDKVTIDCLEYVNTYEYYEDSNYTSNVIRLQHFTIGDYSSSIGYSYDNQGQIKEITSSLGNIYYNYDKQGRLEEEINEVFAERYRYFYDDNHNVIKKITYNAQGTSVVRTDFTDPYSSSSNFYPSSLNNNLTFEFGRLVRYGDITFEYDIFGKRIKKTIGLKETDYFYEGNNLIYQGTDEESLSFIYGDNGIIGLVHKTIDEGNEVTKEYYLQKNILGDVIAIYYNENNEYKRACRYAYDAWGNHKIFDANGNEVTSPDHIGNINPIRYRGYYYDVETQLFYCTSRYYSPELCRWISPDSIEYLDPSSINGLNLYAYCGNNPVMYYDPTGHSMIGAMLLTGLIMGLAMVAFQGASDLATYAQTGNWDHFVWQDYVGNFVGGFVGGALSVVLTSGLAASLAATGVSRLVSMNLQNATGDANYSTWDIAKDVGLSMLVTTVTYGLTYGIGNKLSGNNYFKTYSDLPYLLGHGLTKGVEKGVVNQFMYQYAVMTMNMGLIASFGDYVVGYKWKNKLLGAY